MPENEPYAIANYIGKETSIKIDKKPIKEKIDIKLEKLPRDLVAIAENVARISGTWNPVEIYTPNVASQESEKKKFFEAHDKGEEYNPQFIYEYANSLDLKTSRERLLTQMHALRDFGEKKKRFFWQKHDKKGGKLTLDRGTRIFRTALYFKIKDDLATCDLVDGIKSKSEEKINAALKQKYPGIDQSLYDLAVSEYVKMSHPKPEGEEKKEKGLLSDDEIKWLGERKVKAPEIAEAFKWALSRYGLLRTSTNGKGFMVKISKEATNIDVRDKSVFGPTVFIPENREFDTKTLLGLIAHEIEGHARQSVNGEEVFLLGGGRLKIDNEQLYEGLGKRYETMIEKKLFGSSESTPVPYATFAVKMADEGNSFAQIFKDQLERRIQVKLKTVSTIEPADMEKIKDNAWTTTYRTMRGHVDMTNPNKFAMTKDLSYLRGYQMDKQLVENGLGFINEEGVIAQGGLALIAELKLSPEKLPHPFLDVATQYWDEVLKPQYKSSPPKPKNDVISQAEEVAKKAWDNSEVKEKVLVSA